MHYLDANATEPLRPESEAVVADALHVIGNPASVHGFGRAARRRLEDARDLIAGRFGGDSANLVFTSGGTEANALAIAGLGAGRQIIVSAIEHHAVQVAAPAAAVLSVSARGVADLGALADWLAASGPALVCLMLANNETGVLQPVAEAASLCRRHGAILHVDAVQAAGRIRVDLRTLGAHSLALSSHKLGGPAGAGALLLSSDAPPLPPLIAGGGQERGRRGGTPALSAIAGFAAAASAPTEAGRLTPLRDAAERAAVGQGAIVCGGGAERLPNTTCLALPGARADAQVIALDLAGVAVSAGAACSSGKMSASHVLAAMGLGPLAGQAIRVSLPWNATRADVEAFASAYADMAARLRPTLAPAVG